MSRFFVQKENIKDNIIEITGDDVLHIQRVLRMRKGDFLVVCDGDKTDYNCRIEEIGKEAVLVTPQKISKNNCEPDCRITLFQGLPKGDKMEQLIQKCVELGVHKIVPVMTKRVVAKGDKNARWSKVSVEAAKQCGRGILPEVLPVMKFDGAVKTASEFDLAIIPYEEEKEIGLKSVLKTKSAKSVAVFIGPLRAALN